MQRNAPQDGSLVHDENVTDETARLYDVPVDEATYDHLKGMTTPEGIFHRPLIGAGLSAWLNCAEPMQQVWLSHDKQGPKAYLSSDPAGQAGRRVDIVKATGGDYSDTDVSKASYTHEKLESGVREAMKARLQAALANFPDAMAELLRAREADIAQSLTQKTAWRAKLEKGRYEEGLQKSALISPDPWWQTIKLHQTARDNHWVQFWLMQLRQSLANAFEQQADWKLNSIVNDTVPDLACHTFKIKIARVMMGRNLELWVFHKDRRR